jgi:hypothetical protein
VAGDRLPLALGTELGLWLTLHVERYRSSILGLPLRWQWASGLTAWLLERAGIVELLARSPEDGHALIVNAGFAANATRQRPFTQWARGVRSCEPGCSFFGMRVASLPPRALQLQWVLRPETQAMLDAIGAAMEVDPPDPGPRDGTGMEVDDAAHRSGAPPEPAMRPRA